ncbi:MAG: hypothetical protein M9897_02840 [Brumimicrobium sp.]|nr:hypothetical protein [Brumimicrobium sp.]
MKQFLAISFLFVFLTGNTDLRELAKFPMLIHHYVEHLEEEGGESIIDFIAMHYSDSHHNKENTSHEHDKLPFKSIQHNFAQSAIDIPILFNGIEKNEFIDNEYGNILYIPSQYSNSFLTKIWQPPRLS